MQISLKKYNIESKTRIFFDPNLDFFKNDLYQRQLYTRITYITDVVCKRTRRSVYVAAAAACKSGTLGFGDGNGCAPPGLRKPAPGLNIGVDFT